VTTRPAVLRHAAPRPDAGFSIVLVVSTILVLLVLGLGVVALVTEDSDLAATQVASDQAFYVAQAGLEYAVQKVTSTPSWNGLPPPGKGVGLGTFWVSAPDTLDARKNPLQSGRRRIVATGRVGAATRVLEIQVAPGTISTVAGGDSAAWDPEGLAVAMTGDLVVADPAAHVVRRLDVVTGIVSIVAGTGVAGSSGDGGRSEAATLRAPHGVGFGPGGDLYIADAGAHVVRKVSAASGVITTVAGSGSPGSSGDGGPATSARLMAPTSVAVTDAGDLFIAERGGNRIRMVSAGGIITTIAGTGAAGYAGDNGPAAAARLRAPEGIALARNGDLYIADTGNHAIRRVARATGIITTVAGTGSPGFGGDGASAAAASLRSPRAVAVSPGGDLYIADTGNDRVRRIEIASADIATVTGTGVPGFRGDGGPSSEARLHAPVGLAVAPSGEYYIGCQANGRVRKVTGVLSVVAWTETGS
jgi:sugar lactone lactonase YvrE